MTSEGKVFWIIPDECRITAPEVPGIGLDAFKDGSLEIEIYDGDVSKIITLSESEAEKLRDWLVLNYPLIQ